MREGDVTCPENVSRFPALRSDRAERKGDGFQTQVAAAIGKHFPSAVRLVRDQYPRHLAELSGDQLFSIGVALYQEGDMEKARSCLELAVVAEGSWQHKAMLLVSHTYEAIGNVQKAIAVIQDLLDRQPEKTFRRQAMKRLLTLQQQDGAGEGAP